MTLFQGLKQNARLALKGHWKKVILATLILLSAQILLNGLEQAIIASWHLQSQTVSYELPNTIVTLQKSSWGEDVIQFIFSLIEIMIIIPLSMGYTLFLYGLSEGREMKVGDMFTPFEGSLWGRSIGTQLLIIIRVFFVGILMSIIPSGIFFIGYQLMNRQNGSIGGILLLILAVLIAIVCVALLLLYAARFFCANLLLLSPYEYDARSAISLSVFYTKKYLKQVVLFFCSNILWFLLCAFIIPVMYVLPFVSMSMIVMKKYLIESQTEKTDIQMNHLEILEGNEGLNDSE